MTTGVRTVVAGQAMQVTIDTRLVEQVIARAPKVAHFWLHGFLNRAMIDHRVAWLKSKGTRFGRATAGSRAIKVHRVNEGPATPGETDVVYRVFPRQQRPATVEDAVAGLREMGAEAFLGSVVLRVHEFGEDVHARRKLLAIPVRTRERSPAAFQARYPDKRLELRPARRGGDTRALLYEVSRSRGRGRPRKGASLAALREKLRLRFVLTKHAEMHPTLRFFASWDQLESKREALWRGAADRMQRQLQAGDPRDF